jgi:hypothetical protein
MLRVHELEALGYLHPQTAHLYYTALVRIGLGVCIAKMHGGWMIQFFPWTDLRKSGHDTYASFLHDKATAVLAANGQLMSQYPFLDTKEDDILLIKCLVEEGIKQVERYNEQVRN